LHPLPLDASILTPPLKSVVPEMTDREAEVGQNIPVSRTVVISGGGGESHPPDETPASAVSSGSIHLELPGGATITAERMVFKAHKPERCPSAG
jgi:hypothetical protein